MEIYFMATIVPAILETTPEHFLLKLSQVTKLSGVERVQVDFADGQFVPNTTVPVTEIEPLSPGFHWEAHLMVKEPVDFLDYQIAGFNTVIVHLEAFTDKSLIVPALEQIKKLGMKAGLAVNSETSVNVLTEFSTQADQFLLLSVVPGFQGHPFIESTYERLRELRALLPHGILEVDGGIKLPQVKPLIAAGADYLAIGSGLFETENLQTNFDMLLKETI